MNFEDLQGGKICIYPYSEEVQPVLRHGALLSPGWKVAALVSPRSWGFAGQELQCGGETLTVAPSFDHMPDDIDYILIPGFFGNLISPSVVKRMLSRISPILGRLRGVILSAVLDDENYEMLKNACHGSCEFIDLNATPSNLEPVQQFEKREGIVEIDVPVVGIMGMWESTDKFEVSLALREKFIRSGYRVSQIGSRNYCELMRFHSFPRFMLDPTAGEEDKIYRLNRYLKQLVEEESPNVILMTIPGGTQQLNNQFPNGFGILPFLVSKAAVFDALILCTLYEPNAGELFELISTSFKYKYGCEADAFHMSNMVFDAAAINEQEMMRLNHISRGDVAKAVQENYAGLASPMVDVYSAGGAEKLYNTIVDKLTGNVADAI